MLNQSAINQLRNQSIYPQCHFINGKEHKGNGQATQVINPANGQAFSEIMFGETADAELAISSARQSFDKGSWRNMPPQARKKILHKFADLVEANALEMAVKGSRENGTEISTAFFGEPMSATNTIRYYAECIDKVYGEIVPSQNDILAMVQHSPIGVVGAIIPWNFPMMIAAWKLAPALAMGNSVVMKPAETASLNILHLAKLASEAGIPDGVFNVVTGTGKDIGKTIALSHDVDVMAFTGSGATGKQLLKYSAESNLKPCYLELGGKSPNIIFADADLELAAAKSVNAIFRDAGQICVAGSRLLIEKSISKKFIELLQKYTENLVVGDPLNLETHVGAINSKRQQQTILEMIENGMKEGSELICGGEPTLQDTGGCFIKPTIVKLDSNKHYLAQNEVFGPVLCVIEFNSEEEAVAIANDSVYGLAAGVWTKDLSKAHRMINAINAGVVHVNTYGGVDVSVPMGGMKQSGNGYDKSLHALGKYLKLKTAWVQL